MKNYRLLVILSLIIIFIVIQYMNPKTIEVPKEVIVEKEIIVEVEVEKEVVVEKEVIVEKEVEIIVEKEPTYIYNITSEEREMLARLVYLEANIESLESQKAIVSVVINRWQNGFWGDTLKEVIYYKNQFTPAKLIYKTTPTETNYKAVDYVLKNGITIPEYVMYFRMSYGFSKIWNDYQEYKKIDQTCFGYFEKDKIRSNK